MNKQIAKCNIGGAELSVHVFDMAESARQGECGVVMRVSVDNGCADVRGYVMPAELLAIGHALIEAALLAEKVVAMPGYLTKYKNKAG